MWLLKSEIAERLAQFSKTGFVPTADQLHAFMARAPRTHRSSSQTEEIMSISGDTAVITVSGVLTEQPDFWAWMLGIGNTTYSDIRAAFADAGANPAVKRVTLRVASPGGHVDGLFDTLAAIQAFGKPISVTAAQACSAAYALAAVAGTIEATGPAAEFGSIGVAASFSFDASEQIVNVTSTEAPNKRPDPRTPEGKAVVVKYLDAVHELFADAVAKGRGTTIGKVNTGFGRGASMLARAAKSAGMIDRVADYGGTGTHNASSNGLATAIGKDFGDLVADEVDRQLGRNPDLQDTVAARMAARRGTSLVTTTEHPANGRQGLDAYLAECEALGPRNTMTGLRPTQDLGDAVAERMAEQRKGY